MCRNTIAYKTPAHLAYRRIETAYYIELLRQFQCYQRCFVCSYITLFYECVGIQLLTKLNSHQSDADWDLPTEIIVLGCDAVWIRM